MQSPWAVILCKFNDDDSEPHPKQYYQDLFTSSGAASQRDMVRYFRDYSHGTLDVGGTRIFGWYSLDKSVADYNALEFAREKLIKWARDAAKADGVDLSPFVSTIVCTNLWHDIGATWSGVVAQGPDTQVPQLLAHEMGHVYGLNHSRIDGSEADYQDPWDVMSAATTFSAPDPEFTLIGPGLNACNMRSRGWLNESRVWSDAAANIDETITLRPLVARELSGWLAADIPGGYTAEFRVSDGWDGAIPRPAVLIHRFDGGASYIMRGKAGVPDLVAGDSFGDLPPNGFDLPYRRVDVLSIDAAAQEAVLRIRGRRLLKPGRDPVFHEPVAIDPMSLVLSTKAYLIWLDLKFPHGPRPADLQALLGRMAPEEQRAAAARAGELVETGKLVQTAMGASAGARPRGNVLSRFLLRLSQLVGGLDAIRKVN